VVVENSLQFEAEPAVLSAHEFLRLLDLRRALLEKHYSLAVGDSMEYYRAELMQTVLHGSGCSHQQVLVSAAEKWLG
jgi:hypothetical protein